MDSFWAAFFQVINIQFVCEIEINRLFRIENEIIYALDFHE